MPTENDDRVEFVSSTPAASAVEDNPRPTQRSKRAATPVHRASEADGNVAEPHRVPTRDRDADAADVDTYSRGECVDFVDWLRRDSWRRTRRMGAR